MKKLKLIIWIVQMFIFSAIASIAQTILPGPNKYQLAWHEMEFYLFAHFGPNTFTGKEWGRGDEPEHVFYPAAFDAAQWCRIAKAAGAKGIIITAKHHDGFCLWPSKYSAHTVRESKWRNGKGDVLRELSDACKQYGLKFGVYISPWDRNHPQYGTDAYNDVFVNMMKEIFQNYGPIWELWWDGANGEGPNGKKQVYNWHRYENLVRMISPGTIVFSDIGPDIRWVGNEKGIAGKTNWNYLDTAGFTRGLGAPPTDTLNEGNLYGKNWIPAECDVSIRPGWFYHADEDSKVKTPEQLFDLYLKSVGRGASLLLNVPPDRSGLINEKDSAALKGFKKLRDANFRDPLAFKFAEVDGKHANVSIYKLKSARTETINCIVLKEDLLHGQKIYSFTIRIKNHNTIALEINGTTIGRKRIITFHQVNGEELEIIAASIRNKPEINEISVYRIDDSLVEK